MFFLSKSLFVLYFFMTTKFEWQKKCVRALIKESILMQKYESEEMGLKNNNNNLKIMAWQNSS